MPRTYAELLREARVQVPQITALEADKARVDEPDLAIVDVREDSEWEQGHIPGAIHISKSYVEQEIEGAVSDRDAPVILYCAGGVRSLFAGQALQALGYTNVRSMTGGFQDWKSKGLAWSMPAVLNHEQKQSYSRHLMMPEFGTNWQAKILD
jgi:rhodanese-related sulfurtransferase